MKVTDIKSDYLGMSVGKIVAKDYRKAMVFKSYGIDFCCGGKISVEQAALEANVDLEELIGELEELDKSTVHEENFIQMETDALIDHIVNKHHSYVKNTIEQLTPLVNKVAMVHGEWRPELEEIKDLFRDVSIELTQHMQKEEIILFPAIRALARGEEIKTGPGNVGQPITMMEMEHDIAGDLMKRINELSNNYTLPVGACATYTVVYKVLKEFEDDLHQHIHLENNILFPRALAMENNNCES